MSVQKTLVEVFNEAISSILSSDDSNLDQLQEIVDYIKQNRDKIENLSIDDIKFLKCALELKVNISDIVNNLTSTLTNAPLSANQGRVLDEKIVVLDAAVDSIKLILSSDDEDLLKLQEIVDFIKINREKIENLKLSDIAETQTLKHFTKAMLEKLEGIEEGANKYELPKTFPIEKIDGLQNSLDLKVNIADIVDNLTTALVNAPLSANQGKVLNEQIASLDEAIKSIKTILSSDDTSLDELQEIVNYIKQNKGDLSNLNLSNIAETETLKHFTKIMLEKLEGIEEGANKYVHPSTHKANIITQDSSHRFVSDTQINTWNSKANKDTNTWRPISDSVTSSSSTTSASSKAVKAAYDKAVTSSGGSVKAISGVGPTRTTQSGSGNKSSTANYYEVYNPTSTQIKTRLWQHISYSNCNCNCGSSND